MKLNSLLWPCLLLLGWMLPILAADKPPKVKEVPKEVEIFRAPDLPDRTVAEVEVYTDDITLSEEPEITKKYAKKAMLENAAELPETSLIAPFPTPRTDREVIDQTVDASAQVLAFQ